MHTEFLTYLAEQGAMPRHLLDRAKSSIRHAPEPIGSLAFLHGLIRAADIDDILDEQRRSRRPFGHIAKEKGLLTEEQIRRLLAVQRIRGAVSACETLILSGAAPTEVVSRHLAAFLSQSGSSVGGLTAAA